MRPGVYFPYRIGDDSVSLTIEDVRGAVATGSHSVDAYSEESQQVELDIKLEYDLAAVRDQVAPSTDTDEEDFIAGVRLVAKEARRREFRLISRESNGRSTLRFNRSDLVGTVTLTGLILRGSALDAPNPGYAADRGSVVAWSEDVDVHFDPREPSITGENLDVRWASFKADPRVKDKVADLFAIVEEADQPVVLLNSDIDSAYYVLDSKGTHGARARIRDATFHLITHQVWSSLVADALQRFRFEAGQFFDAAESDVLEEIGGWRAMVLEDWAPFLVGESDDPVASLLEAPEGVLMERLPHAIQSRFKTVGGFHGLVRDIEALGGS